jgi:O-acetylserine/cysteine efflux transporter
VTKTRSLTGEDGFAARDWLVIALVNLMWGLNIVAAKMAVDTISPMTAGFLRQAMVALACLPWLRFVPGRMAMVLAFSLASGALMFIPLNLALATASNMSALSVAGQLTVPFSVILSVIFLHERIHMPRIIGLCMAFAGVVLIGFDPAMAHEAAALVLVALSSLALACGSLAVRKLADVPVATLYAWLGLIGAVVLGLTGLIVEREAMAGIATLPASAFGWVAFSALGSSLVGHGGLAWLLQRHPVGVVMPYTLIAPVLSVIVSAIMFDAPVTGIMLLGGTIVLAGVAIVTIRTAARGTLAEELS